MPVPKVKEISQIKPRIGQGRAGMRCKIKTQTSKPIVQTIEQSKVEPKTWQYQWPVMQFHQ